MIFCRNRKNQRNFILHFEPLICNIRQRTEEPIRCHASVAQKNESKQITSATSDEKVLVASDKPIVGFCSKLEYPRLLRK